MCIGRVAADACACALDWRIVSANLPQMSGDQLALPVVEMVVPVRVTLPLELVVVPVLLAAKVPLRVAGAGADRGEQAGAVGPYHRFGLRIGGAVIGDVLVRHLDFFFQRGQHRVAKQAPPLPLGHIIGGHGGVPTRIALNAAAGAALCGT
jgi:hypothetical protein